MTQTQTAPPSPDAAPVPRGLAGVLGPLRRVTRYHGIWGPGVALLRNMSLRSKALLVAALVASLAGLLFADALLHRLNSRDTALAAVAGVDEMRAVSALQASALDISRAIFLTEAEGVPNVLKAARDAESAAYIAYRQTLEARLVRLPLLQSADATLQARRRELIARLGEPVGSPALAALPSAPLAISRRYADAIDALRVEQQAAWAPTLDSDLESRVLLDGLVLMAIDTRVRMQRLWGLAAALHAADGPLQRRALHAQLVEVRTVMKLASASFNHARAATPENARAMDEDLRSIDQSLGRLDSVVAAPAETRMAELLPRDVLRQHFASSTAATQRLEALGLQLILQRLQSRQQAADSNLLVASTSLALTALALGYLLICTYKVIAGGLAFLCRQVDELGRGNLAIRPSGHGRDEIGRALTVLGESAARISALFEAVTHGVAAVSHASRVVAAGNAGLTGRTEDIRTSVSTVSGSTQTFASAMSRCTDAVDRAADNLRAMRIEEQRCRKAMAGLTVRMRTLQGKSREIVQVVGLIEAVAYQTRLLAINASIEAARAGPEGRGFAVVAQEVRALAVRSQTASKQIEAIVESSIAEIDAGNQMSERLNEALLHADQEIDAVSGVMAEIIGLVRSSQQQSLAVLGVTREADESIQHNARLVQQLSQASAELRDEGDALKRSLQHFEFA